MTTYKRKPPAVEAFQWDGTAEGAEDLINFLRGQGRSFSFTITTYGDAAGFGEPRLKISHDAEGEMHPGNWIIVEEGARKMAVVSAEYFRSHFEEVT